MSTVVRYIASVVPSALASVMAFVWPFVMTPVARASPVTQDKASPVLLTHVVSSDGDALRQAAGDGDIGMLLDAKTLSVSDAHAVVFAIEDAQAAGRDVIAIVNADLQDGSAVVAAACQGMVMIGDVSLTGCSDSWCSSPSRRASLLAQLTQSGGRDRTIAERLLGGTSALSYSPTQGPHLAPVQGGGWSITLARQGKPMKLDVAALHAIHWSGQTQVDVASAMAAIAAGQLKTQPKVPTRRAGAGSAAPPPPQGNPAPPAPPAGALPPAAAIEFANIQKDLTTLKATIQKFNGYFTGKVGVWTEKSKSLRDVWKYKEMTKDKTTADECRNLEQQLRQIAERMSGKIETVERSVKGSALPQREKLADLKKHLDGLMGDLKNRRSEGYEERSKKLVDATIK